MGYAAGTGRCIRPDQHTSFRQSECFLSRKRHHPGSGWGQRPIVQHRHQQQLRGHYRRRSTGRLLRSGPWKPGYLAGGEGELLGSVCPRKDVLPGSNSLRARDLKLSTTGVRNRLLTAIPISDIGIRSTISQATTEATLCLTAEAGRMVKPMPEATSETSVGTSAAVWETLGAIPASRSIPKIKSWNPGAYARSYPTKS